MPSFSTIGSMDMSGTTANRPSNAEIGQTYFDTTIGALAVYNGTSWEVEGGDVATSTVAAAGTNQGNAASLSTGFNLVTAADGTKGVKLPTAAAGVTVEGYNNSASSLKVYPNTSDDINDGTVNVHVTVAANTAFRFVASDTVTWAGVYAAGGTYATLTGTEELTNKTVTAPVVSTGLTASGSASNDFSGSTGTFKTSSGLNTLSGYTQLKITASASAAAGSTVADAAQLASSNITVISSDGATKGNKLPTGVAGQFQFVINSSATAAELYAASGGTVNGLAADASVVVPASKGVLCLCTAADTWTVFDMPAKATAS